MGLDEDLRKLELLREHTLPQNHFFDVVNSSEGDDSREGFERDLYLLRLLEEHTSDDIIETADYWKNCMNRGKNSRGYGSGMDYAIA